MKVPTNFRYAIRMLVALSEHQDLVNTTQLASALDVSPLYLRQIALELKKGRLIKSVKGARGGYQLTKDPANITIAQVAKSMGSSFIPHCKQNYKACRHYKTCKTKNFWLGLKNQIDGFLNSVTIKDIISDNMQGF